MMMMDDPNWNWKWNRINRADWNLVHSSRPSNMLIEFNQYELALKKKARKKDEKMVVKEKINNQFFSVNVMCIVTKS